MDELFKQYGGPIITVVAIVALIAVVTLVIKSSGTSFQGMVESFTGRMNTQSEKAMDDSDINLKGNDNGSGITYDETHKTGGSTSGSNTSGSTTNP